jgi:hypothetical protein
MGRFPAAAPTEVVLLVDGEARLDADDLGSMT